MANYIPVSQERHGGKGWRKPDGYAFALAIETAPLVAAEMVGAAGSLPIIFLRREERFAPAALMGIGTGRNLFLTESGKWLGGYVPAALRTHPFRIGRTPQGGTVLCVDEASGLVSQARDAQAFFAEDGEPSAALKEILDLLTQVERSRNTTDKAMAALDQAKLISPWPIRVRTRDGEKPLEGLFRIEEAALRALSPEALESLHEAGALEIAYCQLVSRQHVSLLSRLVQAHEYRERTARRDPIRKIFETSGDGDLQIDWDRLGRDD